MGQWLEKFREAKETIRQPSAPDQVAKIPQGNGSAIPNAVVQPGMTVQYQIPVRITSPTKYEWAWHRGTIERVDEDWQMALVIPETEETPWRWIWKGYIKAEGSE